MYIIRSLVWTESTNCLLRGTHTYLHVYTHTYNLTKPTKYTLALSEDI
jgi:hypothetical protein